MVTFPRRSKALDIILFSNALFESSKMKAVTFSGSPASTAAHRHIVIVRLFKRHWQINVHRTGVIRQINHNRDIISAIVSENSSRASVVVSATFETS
ncbi:hypothetical protein M8J76_016799 [Diaphorina citri]|nr:hypothetical protein M8J76_016799 [Diaphorina citri]